MRLGLGFKGRVRVRGSRADPKDGKARPLLQLLPVSLPQPLVAQRTHERHVHLHVHGMGVGMCMCMCMCACAAVPPL